MTDHGGDPDPTIDPPEDASTGAAAPGFDAAAGDMVGPFKIIGTLTP